MSDDCYNRKGEPIGTVEWARKLNDVSYKTVAKDKLSNCKFVSTVWLGLNHGPEDAPLIFETMVFESDQGGLDLDCQRYATEEEAVAGHAAMVEKWRMLH